MSADEQIVSPELAEMIKLLEADAPLKPVPVAIPPKALAMLRQLHEQIVKNQGQMKGIVQGVASVLDIPVGAGVDLESGVFITE